jgi:type I restriction enzyme, S subunit
MSNKVAGASSSRIPETRDQDAPSTLVPKLRFPEFRDAAGWDEKRLGEVASFFKGKGISKAEIAANGRHPCIRYGELYTRYGEVIDEVFSRTDAAEADLFFSRSNDVIIPGSGETKLDIAKASCVMHDDVALGGDLNVIRTEHTGVFLSYYFNGPKKWDIAKVAQGDTVVHLYPSQLAKLAIALPKEPEQQKIAECLSSVDDLIAAQARKLDALKTHKKGLMQQLFPREGETQPRLRFPEFQAAGEWGGGDLGSKTIKVGSGITPNGGDKNYKQSGRPFVRSQNVGWGELILNDVAFVDEETHSSFSSTEIQVRDVLLNITGASIGRSAVADARIAGGNVNQHVCIIRVKAAELNHFYLNQYLISPEGQKQIDSFQAGGNRQGLNFAQIRSFTIPLPPKVLEQQRVADCLTSLDDLIAAQTQKLNALKTHKKGLMQQLFPSPQRVEA